jgi:hypothetical protein
MLKRPILYSLRISSVEVFTASQSGSLSLYPFIKTIYGELLMHNRKREGSGSSARVEGNSRHSASVSNQAVDNSPVVTPLRFRSRYCDR